MDNKYIFVGHGMYKLKSELFGEEDFTTVRDGYNFIGFHKL